MQRSQSAGVDVQPRPLRHATELHWIFWAQLWLPVHRTSHAQELPHEMPRHELSPEQPTVHGPDPHWTFSHAFLPEQSISHDAACWQLMPLRHEFSVLHAISQL
jgi:hypothetical protein